MIAARVLFGILLAIFAVVGISLDMSGVVSLGNIGGVVLMIIMILSLLKFSNLEKEESLMRKNKKDKKQDINYLDLIPETNQSIRWHRDLKQRIILEIENKGMFNTIAQKVFGKPRFSKVHLDEMGTFYLA